MRSAETDEDRNACFRKPNPVLWHSTFMVVTYGVLCVLLLILTASGVFLNSQSFECNESKEDLVAFRLKKEARLIYSWSGFSLLVCVLVLLEFWRRNGFYTKVIPVATCFLFMLMLLSFHKLSKQETQEIDDFEEHYLALLPLRDGPGETQEQLMHKLCHKRNNIYHWQAQFKCCGLQGYNDWRSSFPNSCLCDAQENSSVCVKVGDSIVYKQPCLPIVLSHMKKRSSTFWVVMIFWIIIVGAPLVISILCLI